MGQFCRVFGTEAGDKGQLCDRVDPTCVYAFVTSGKVDATYLRFDEIYWQYGDKECKYQNEFVHPLITEKEGKLGRIEGKDCLEKARRKIIENREFLIPPVLREGVAVVSYLTPQNYKQYARKYPFTNQ